MCHSVLRMAAVPIPKEMRVKKGGDSCLVAMAATKD